MGTETDGIDIRKLSIDKTRQSLENVQSLRKALPTEEAQKEFDKDIENLQRFLELGLISKGQFTDDTKKRMDSFYSTVNSHQPITNEFIDDLINNNLISWIKPEDYKSTSPKEQGDIRARIKQKIEAEREKQKKFESNPEADDAIGKAAQTAIEQTTQSELLKGRPGPEKQKQAAILEALKNHNKKEDEGISADTVKLFKTLALTPTDFLGGFTKWLSENAPNDDKKFWELMTSIFDLLGQVVGLAIDLFASSFLSEKEMDKLLDPEAAKKKAIEATKVAKQVAQERYDRINEPSPDTKPFHSP